MLQWHESNEPANRKVMDRLQEIIFFMFSFSTCEIFEYVSKHNKNKLRNRQGLWLILKELFRVLDPDPNSQ
jgi:hypothetical protein